MATNKITNKAKIVYGTKDYYTDETEIELPDLAPGRDKEATLVIISSNKTIHYKITIKNKNNTVITSLPFSDDYNTNINIPVSYIANSFKVNSVVTVPTATTPILTYTIPTIAANATVVIEFDILVIE